MTTDTATRLNEMINGLTEDERLVYDTLIDTGLCFYTCDENHAESRCVEIAVQMAKAVVANYPASTRLLNELDHLHEMLARVPVVAPCSVNPPAPRCGVCPECRDLRALDDEVRSWDRETSDV